MATYRVDKLNSFIRSLVGDVIAHKLNDPRVSRFASVTRVETSGDLQLARVFVSVMGSPAEERRTMQGLQHAAGHIQRLVGKQLSLRHVPEIRFVLDESIKGAAQTLRLIDEALKDSPAPDPGAPDEESGRDASGEDIDRSA